LNRKKEWRKEAAVVEKAKKALMEAAFVADELRLFLDTHPDNADALRAYRAAVEEMRTQQQALPDAVCALDGGKNGNWDWNNTPMPWEKEE
jgi:spore coat protein JB